MESLDRQILSLLAADGRMSYTDIGRETGLSTSAAQQRVRRLEQRGVITGYRATIAPEALGVMLTAFVQIQPFFADQPDDTPELIRHIPQISACYSVAGETSYLLKVQAANTVQLEKLLAEIRAAGKVSTHTTVVLSIPYEDRPVISAAPADQD